MSILSSTDFVGTFSIAQDQFTAASLTEYINEKEAEYLSELLGEELSELLYDDLDSNNEPQTAKFVTIFNAFTETFDDCGCFSYWPMYTNWLGYFGCDVKRQVTSKGIKFYLKAMLYFDFVRDYPIGAGIGSVGENENTNKKSAGYNMAWLCKRFNEGAFTGKVIQWKIKKNESDYPEFSGNPIDYVINI